MHHRLFKALEDTTKQGSTSVDIVEGKSIRILPIQMIY